MFFRIFFLCFKENRLRLRSLIFSFAKLSSKIAFGASIKKVFFASRTVITAQITGDLPSLINLITGHPKLLWSRKRERVLLHAKLYAFGTQTINQIEAKKIFPPFGDTSRVESFPSRVPWLTGSCHWTLIESSTKQKGKAASFIFGNDIHIVGTINRKTFMTRRH